MREDQLKDLLEKWQILGMAKGGLKKFSTSEQKANVMEV